MRKLCKKTRIYPNPLEQLEKMVWILEIFMQNCRKDIVQDIPKYMKNLTVPTYNPKKKLILVKELHLKKFK